MRIFLELPRIEMERVRAAPSERRGGGASRNENRRMFLGHFLSSSAETLREIFEIRRRLANSVSALQTEIWILVLFWESRPNDTSLLVDVEGLSSLLEDRNGGVDQDLWCWIRIGGKTNKDASMRWSSWEAFLFWNIVFQTWYSISECNLWSYENEYYGQT